MEHVKIEIYILEIWMNYPNQLSMDLQCLPKKYIILIIDRKKHMTKWIEFLEKQIKLFL